MEGSKSDNSFYILDWQHTIYTSRRDDSWNGITGDWIILSCIFTDYSNYTNVWI